MNRFGIACLLGSTLLSVACSDRDSSNSKATPDRQAPNIACDDLVLGEQSTYWLTEAQVLVRQLEITVTDGGPANQDFTIQDTVFPTELGSTHSYHTSFFCAPGALIPPDLGRHALVMGVNNHWGLFNGDRVEHREPLGCENTIRNLPIGAYPVRRCHWRAYDRFGNSVDYYDDYTRSRSGVPNVGFVGRTVREGELNESRADLISWNGVKR